MCKAMKSLLSILLVIFLSAGWVGSVQSQDKYPNRAVQIIVPMAPGGSTDLMARITGAHMNKKWQVPVNVVNKPGGATVPACLEVYNASPDGYTVLMDGNPSASLLPAAVRSLPFKIMDRTFIALTDIVPMVIMVSMNSPFKSLKDLEAQAKKDPEHFTWTSNTSSGVNDYAIRQFLKAIGVDVKKTKPVIDQGGSQSVTNTAGGHVVMGCASVASSLPGIRGGLLRPLAVTSKTRWPQLADVPTTEELGYPTVTAQNWHGISGPPNLPVHIAEVWNKALQEMVKDPDVMSKLNSIGAIPYYHNAKETREIAAKDTEEVRELWDVK